MPQSLAFVFPGQGSQHLGMLAELAESNPVIKDTFAEASEVLGYDLWALTQEGPEADLNQTDRTQPALLTAGVALWRMWQEKGGEAPALMAGHSLGEYTALVCAGAIGFKDAVNLVKLRGEFMQQAVPAGTGAMAAILGLADDAIQSACESAAGDEVVSPVNFNCPGQVVIAGNKTAVERAIAACKEAGAKRAIPLPVSVPSHCVLMKPAAEQMAAELNKIEIQMPQITVIQNFTAKAASSVEELIENLLAQLYSPVLWTDSVQSMVDQGIESTVECGPGKVLSGLNKKVHRPLAVAAINEPAGLEKALGRLISAEKEKIMSIEGKVALVTGATRGIGKAIALELGRQGAVVVGTATSDSGADSISGYLKEAGVEGAGLRLDVGCSDSVDQVIKAIQEQFGAVTIIVNNAGITRDNIMMRMKEDEWDSVMNTNLKSIYRVVKGCLRGMTKARWGRVINVSSVVASMGNAGQTNYAAAKAGMEGFSRALAREVASRNITVNCVAPGFIDTDMTSGLAEEHKQTLQNQIPLGRLGQPEEIASVVGFLASEAGGYVTGDTIHVNGGMYMS